MLTQEEEYLGEEIVNYVEEERRQAREPYQNADRVADVIWWSLEGQAPAYMPPPDYETPPPEYWVLPDYVDSD